MKVPSPVGRARRRAPRWPPRVISCHAPGAQDPTESDAARRYWADQGVQQGYVGDVPWAHAMADAVLRSSPGSALEFGCNFGRNLRAIRARDPTVAVAGFDVNAAAVAAGRQDGGPDLRVGDERDLESLPDGAVDVAFTLSVLDHLPQPEAALSQLLRLARDRVLLVEPWLQVEGRVVVDIDERTGCERQTDPYCYSWDYRRILSRLAPHYTLAITPFPLGGPMWGACYQLIEAVRPRRRCGAY
jgi:SAM-dependent methyltransferase